MSTGIAFMSDLPARERVENFDRQLQAQCWTYDAVWSGEYSSGSGWTRSPTADLEPVRLLDVVSPCIFGYRTTFRGSLRESHWLHRTVRPRWIRMCVSGGSSTV